MTKLGIFNLHGSLNITFLNSFRKIYEIMHSIFSEIMLLIVEIYSFQHIHFRHYVNKNSKFL